MTFYLFSLFFIYFFIFKDRGTEIEKGEKGVERRRRQAEGMEEKDFFI